jgi:manganese/zinc/iron transport system substrate-binding protein
VSRLHRLSLIITLLASFATFTGKAQGQDSDSLNVVATTTQAGDLARIIGGDRIEVTQLMTGGVDPHLYQPTEADITAMSEADLILYSGLHLEGQMDEVFEALGQRPDVRIYALSDPVKLAGFVLTPIDPQLAARGTEDPHFWFDPRNWQLVTEGLVEVLSEEDPANAEFYAENGAAYIEQLDLLYQWGVESMETVAEEQRILVTSHDAFQYFGVAFGWQVRGLQGISTEAEAGVGDVQALVQYVIENQIPVMFVESSVPPATIEAVQEAVEAQNFEIGVSDRPLYSDAMGEVGTFGGTYIGMIAENIQTVVTNFGYDDPMSNWPTDLPQPEDYEDVEVDES